MWNFQSVEKTLDEEVDLPNCQIAIAIDVLGVGDYLANDSLFVGKPNGRLKQ